MTGSSWLWAAEVPGLGYREVEARSYADATAQIVRCFGEEPVSLRIAGYRAIPDPQPGAARPVHPIALPELPTRSLGGLALRLYAVLSYDFPTLSILCERQLRYRYSSGKLRDFLANMGTVIQHLPIGQRDLVLRRTRATLESWRHAAAETNARREGDFEAAAYHAERKEGYQDRADSLRRRRGHREAMRTVNLALDGSLPENLETIDRWIDALVANGLPDDEARAMAAHSRRVAVPRL
ncbi:MAG TPA: hypothetical protein PLN64_01570 [Candidatus Bipolaricaulis anaerobius]|nr:hypothetical protein [Candidatus Bipolaricaulis anaerobius]